VKLQTPPPAVGQMNRPEQAEYQQVFIHEGERHARGFRAMAEHPDAYLGWMELPQGVFSVRERSPFKEAFPLEKVESKKELKSLARQWGKVLATEHQRAARFLNRNSDPFIFEKTVQRLYEGSEKAFRALVAEIALQYADCVQADWNTFVNSSYFQDATKD